MAAGMVLASAFMHLEYYMDKAFRPTDPDSHRHADYPGPNNVTAEAGSSLLLSVSQRRIPWRFVSEFAWGRSDLIPSYGGIEGDTRTQTH